MVLGILVSLVVELDIILIHAEEFVCDVQCTNPIFLKKQGLYVPCGHCVSCRIAYTREWSVRLMNEYETCRGKACFITLTYNKEHLPADMSLHKDEIQRFFKRLRKSLGEQKIKYFACGEYGDKNFRPHYHAIIFGLSVQDATIFLPDVWKLGFFDIQSVYYESCKYVTGYVMKKYNGDKAKEVYGDKEIPFRLSSSGLGKSYAIANRSSIFDNQGIYVNGKNCGLPKYYKLLFQKSDLAEVADDITFSDGDFSAWSKVKYETTHTGDYQFIVDSAKARHAEEYESYQKWLANYNPDRIVDNWRLQGENEFEQWRKSVNKLRDLTVKAKCAMHERKV